MNQETCSQCGNEFETKVVIPTEVKGDSFCSEDCYFLAATIQTADPDWKEG